MKLNVCGKSMLRIRPYWRKLSSEITEACSWNTSNRWMVYLWPRLSNPDNLFLVLLLSFSNVHKKIIFKCSILMYTKKIIFLSTQNLLPLEISSQINYNGKRNIYLYYWLETLKRKPTTLNWFWALITDTDKHITTKSNHDITYLINLLHFGIRKLFSRKWKSQNEWRKGKNAKSSSRNKA